MHVSHAHTDDGKEKSLIMSGDGLCTYLQHVISFLKGKCRGEIHTRSRKKISHSRSVLHTVEDLAPKINTSAVEGIVVHLFLLKLCSFLSSIMTMITIHVFTLQPFCEKYALTDKGFCCLCIYDSRDAPVKSIIS